MSSGSPEFVMPPAEPTAVSAPSPAAGSLPAEHGNAARAGGEGGGALLADEPRAARRRLGWRHLLVAALVGALAGAAVPAGLQGLGHAAASAEADALRALASDYLTAIADGRAGDAAAMVPLGGVPTAEIAPDAVLGAARRIEAPEIGAVLVDGAAAVIAASYRLNGTTTRVWLDAARDDAGWRLATSLAEPLRIATDQPGAAVTVAGTELQDRRTHLYPGVYATDRVSGPVLRGGGDRFIVDGDRRTPVEARPETWLASRFAEEAVDRALAVVQECSAEQECPGLEDVRERGEPYVLWIDRASRVLEVAAPLGARRGDGVRWFEVLLRLSYDAEGRASRWECGEPDVFESAFTDCPDPG